MVVKQAELIVDSRNRTRTSRNASTVNDYTWELGTVLKNVISIEVLYAEIPNTYYNVYAGQNSFTIILNGVEHVISIPNGNYNTGTLVVALEAALLATAVAWTGGTGNETMATAFEFAEDTNAHSLILRTKVDNTANSFIVDAATFPYSFGFENSIGSVTTPETFSANKDYAAGSILRLGTEPCLFLSIAELSNHGKPRYNFGNNPSTSVAIDHSNVLTRFQTPDGHNHMNYFTNERNMHERHFGMGGEGPLHLSRLTIRFHRPHGELVDFNGMDHSMHMRIIYDD